MTQLPHLRPDRVPSLAAASRGRQVRLLLGSASGIFLDGLASGLSDAAPGWHVTAMAGDRDEIVILNERHRPHVIVVTDDLDGVPLAEALAGPESRRVPLLILTPTPSAAYEATLCRAGATGVLSTRIDRDTLVATVAELIQGRSAVSAEAVRLLSQGVGGGPNLTPRQREILLYLSEGLSATEIAHQLSLSPSTVKTHISRIGVKLGVDGIRGVVGAVTAPRDVGYIHGWLGGEYDEAPIYAAGS